MNWISVAVRAVLGFAVLFLLGYLLPGFSGFTLTHLLITGILLGFLSTMAEMAFLADDSRKKAPIVGNFRGDDPPLFLAFRRATSAASRDIAGRGVNYRLQLCCRKKIFGDRVGDRNCTP